MSEVDYLRLACGFARDRSNDPRTQVGAALVLPGRDIASFLSTNRIPAALDCGGLRLVAPEKYRYVEHAERAVIYTAAAVGVPTKGATLYATWFACCDCARAIILSGIREVVGLSSLDAMTPDRWRDDLLAAHAMLSEAGVATRWITESVGVTLLFDGKEVDV